MALDETFRDLARLAARVTLGATIGMHGAQKMFGVQGGPGIEGATGMMRSLGFEPAEQYARANAMAEMVSGALISMGALGPVGPAMLLSIMIVAVETVHRPKGYWNSSGGFEMNAMYALVALLLANEGYGRFSIDGLLGLNKQMRASYGWLALAGGAATAIGILSQRRTQQQPQQQQPAASAESGSVESGSEPSMNVLE
jgi:putative oxidoreductase